LSMFQRPMPSTMTTNSSARAMAILRSVSIFA
jgi:hypothetical protein